MHQTDQRSVLMSRMFAMLATSVLIGCNLTKGLCGNKSLGEAISPDGTYVATFFERSCGATTGFYRMVSIRSVKDKCDTRDIADPRALGVRSTGSNNAVEGSARPRDSHEFVSESSTRGTKME